MIGEFFGGIDTRAGLPDLLRIVESWRPDVIIRESWEFTSTIAAELHRVPLARVGLGLTSVEQLSAGVLGGGTLNKKVREVAYSRTAVRSSVRRTPAARSR